MAEFGPERIIETSISEAGFTGEAVGAAMTGMRPVAEISLMDWSTLCMDMICNQAAKTSYMSDGEFRVPAVFLTTMGCRPFYGPQHAQSLHAWFVHVPGVQVILPSTPYDAKGLMMQSLRQDDPVVFIAHRLLIDAEGEVPAGDYTVPFGEAVVRRAGSDVTVVGTGVMAARAVEAAEVLAERGISAEVIDPRTLTPLDRKTIVESAARTRRLVVADDGARSGGVAGEIIASVAEEVILEAPAQRVTPPDTPVPYAPELLEAYLPTATSIVSRVEKVMNVSGGVAVS